VKHSPPPWSPGRAAPTLLRLMLRPPSPGLAHLADALADLERRGLRRRPPTPMREDDRSFSSNDYLGLARRPAPPTRSGAGASRLIAGERQEHAELEAALAEWLETEACLVFSSGYAANVGTLTALAGSGDLIVSDALNHASLIDGMRLSKARVVVTPHNDVDAIDRALAARQEGRAWVVVESYYSMDADGPDLAALRAACDRHRAALFVDEAHALGVLGPDGRGRAAEARITADVLVGTLGKALGSQGAFVAGSALLRDWLWNRARSFVFSTGLAPVSARAARLALEEIRSHADRRERVLANAERLRAGLLQRGLRPMGFGHVIPILAGTPEHASNWSEQLANADLAIPPIRPPTVPEGTSRLRLTVTALHDDSDIDHVIDAMTNTLTMEPNTMTPATRTPASRAPMIVITGTGTEIGKTVVSTGVTEAWARRGLKVAGIKPVESGRTPGGILGGDGEALATVSSFDVTKDPPPYLLDAPVSPHLAARREGRVIDPVAIRDWVAGYRARAEAVVLELPGGLFSPLNEDLTNADLLATLDPTAIVLVAPDRLGVLHDVAATRRAAESLGLRFDGIVLSAPENPDSSTGTNEAELARLEPSLPVLVRLPRAGRAELAPYFVRTLERLLARATHA
jgi:8-amino-7-oxononanoate synthase